MDQHFNPITVLLNKPIRSRYHRITIHETLFRCHETSRTINSSKCESNRIGGISSAFKRDYRTRPKVAADITYTHTKMPAQCADGYLRRTPGRRITNVRAPVAPTPKVGGWVVCGWLNWGAPTRPGGFEGRTVRRPLKYERGSTGADNVDGVND